LIQIKATCASGVFPHLVQLRLPGWQAQRIPRWVKDMPMDSPKLRAIAQAPDSPDAAARRRRMEIYAFLIVTALVMPALAVATVGTYGLTVWIYQAINGPPGPPSK
jgi:nitrate reductase NapE